MTSILLIILLFSLDIFKFGLIAIVISNIVSWYSPWTIDTQMAMGLALITSLLQFLPPQETNKTIEENIRENLYKSFYFIFYILSFWLFAWLLHAIMF